METNCTNCGGILTLESYRDSLTCHYCGTVHIPSLTEDGHIQRLEGPSSEVKCPSCEARLSHAALDGWRFLFCGVCRGLLIRREELLKIILYCRQKSEVKSRVPERVDESHLERTLSCPRCENDMTAHPYYGPGDFVIDSCVSCREVWLDGGELSRAADVKWGGSLWR